MRHGPSKSDPAPSCDGRRTPSFAIWGFAAGLLQNLLAGRQRDSEPGPGSLPETEPRDAALRGMLWSGPLSALTILAVYLLSSDSRLGGALEVFGDLSALLLVPLLVHATQLVTNVRFSELSERWAGLAGWQRGVLGMAIVILAGGVTLSVGFSVAMHLAELPSGR